MTKIEDKKMDDNQNRRQTKWNTTKIEDNQNVRIEKVRVTDKNGPQIWTWGNLSQTRTLTTGPVGRDFYLT